MPTRRQRSSRSVCSRPLQAVDEVELRAGGRVEQRDVRRVEPAARQRRHGECLVTAVRHAFHCRLMGSRVLGPAVADSDHMLPGAPFLVFCAAEPDHRPALPPGEIVARNADGPPEAGGLRDDLIDRVHRFRLADPRDCLHLDASLEELHAERDRPQLQQALQVGGKLCPILRHPPPLGVTVWAPAILYFDRRWNLGALSEFGLRRLNCQEGSPVRVLGVHPGPLMYTKVFLRLEPLGLELVAQSARRAGHATKLLDLQVESHADYYRMVTEWRPDFIAFSCNYLANVPEIVDLSKGTKAVLPRCFICVGGHSASFIGRDIIEHGAGAVDCVLKGE